MLLPFPASSAFSKEDLCCKKQLLEVISGEDPFFFFCLTNQPFCAVWVQWRVTWNLQESYFKPRVFVPNVYQAKTWQGGGVGLGHCHSPCCPWARLNDSKLWAVPGAKLLFVSITDSIPLEGKWGAQICPFCCQPGFCWSQSWNYIFLHHHLKYFVHLKKIIWHLPGISVFVARVWLEFWTPEYLSLWPSEVQFIFHKMSLITHWYK